MLRRRKLNIGERKKRLWASNRNTKTPCSQIFTFSTCNYGTLSARVQFNTKAIYIYIYLKGKILSRSYRIFIEDKPALPKYLHSHQTQPRLRQHPQECAALNQSQILSLVHPQSDEAQLGVIL